MPAGLSDALANKYVCQSPYRTCHVRSLVYICVHAHTHIRTHAQTMVYMHMRAPAHTHACTDAYTHVLSRTNVLLTQM